jgi:hypothetical protein
MACRGHLHIGRDDPHLAELRRHLRQGSYTRAIDAIVVSDEDAHMPASPKSNYPVSSN